MNAIFMNQSVQNAAMLQYLLELGIRGNHPLFEPEEIRRAFDRDAGDLNNMDQDTIQKINMAIKDILQASDIEAQRDLISALEPKLMDVIVLLYFQMLDQNLFCSNPTKH